MYQRKIFTAISLFFINLAVTYSQIQWAQQNSGTTAQLTYVQFLNKDTGFVVGRNAILRTFNGGETWLKDEYIGSQVGLSSVHFVNETVGYASGYDGAFIKTLNSGNSWINLSLDFPGTFYSVFFTSIDTGYLVGYWGAILRTTNGGYNWDILSINEFPILYQIHFKNDDTGFAIGRNGTIIMTNNGGLTWNYINSPTMEPLFHIEFIDDLNGIVTGSNGVILKTLDGGYSWALCISPLSLEFLNSVSYSKNDVAYIAASDGYILETIDNGNSWVPEKLGFDGRLISICFPEPDIGYVVGDEGIILKTEIITSTEEPTISCINLMPNPATNHITIKSIDNQSEYIRFYSCIGSHVLNVLKDSSLTTVDISNFAPGLYVIKLGECQYKFVKCENE